MPPYIRRHRRPSTTKSTAPSGAALIGFDADLARRRFAGAGAGAGVGSERSRSGGRGRPGEWPWLWQRPLCRRRCGTRVFTERRHPTRPSQSELPDETASPFLISTESITPLTGEGTSIAALSDSSEISGSSTATFSPFLTRTSRTVTPLTSPRSGTRTSTVLIAMPSCHRAFLRGTPRSEPPRRRRSRDDHRIGTAAASAAAQRRRARRPVSESTARPRGWRLPAR